MATPTVSAHNNTEFNAGNGTSAALSAPAGCAVYVLIGAGAGVTSVTDSLGNTLTRAAAKSGSASITSFIYYVDNLAGSGTYTVKVTLSASAPCAFVVLIITGQATPSLGGTGAGTAGGYTSATNEGDTVTPVTAADLILLAFGLVVTVTSGSPTLTYNSVAGESLVDSGKVASTRTMTGLGAYTLAATTTNPTVINGNANFAGTGAASTWAAIGVSVKPAPASVSGAEHINEASTLKLTLPVSGSEHIAEVSSLTTVSPVSGAEHINELATLSTRVPVSGAEHINELATLSQAAKVFGSEHVGVHVRLVIVSAQSLLPWRSRIRPGGKASGSRHLQLTP